MTIKFGMTFAGAVPDFGSIEKCDDRRYTLLTADLDKLNSTLTRATCQPLLKKRQCVQRVQWHIGYSPL